MSNAGKRFAGSNLFLAYFPKTGFVMRGRSAYVAVRINALFHRLLSGGGTWLPEGER